MQTSLFDTLQIPEKTKNILLATLVVNDSVSFILLPFCRSNDCFGVCIENVTVGGKLVAIHATTSTSNGVKCIKNLVGAS